MTWPEIWFGESLSAKAIRTALTPASWLYGLGWRAYVACYRLGLKKPSRPHSPVICVGNLVVGGSGKTPVTVFLARHLISKGRRVVISASGYGSPASEAAAVAPEGLLDPAVWGDEPALLREELPDVPLIVGRRRVLAAELCHKHFPDAVMLMDDGLQHLPLGRDLNLVIDPPGSNRRCLPAGPYREPKGSFAAVRGRIVFIRSARAERNGRAEPELTVTYSDLEFSGPKPAKANVLCALGNPSGFVASVRDSGVELARVSCLPDHDPLTGPVFEDMDPSIPVVVTLKDWVKLRTRTDVSNVIVARRIATVGPMEELDKLLGDL